jgi:hypothetical protein
MTIGSTLDRKSWIDSVDGSKYIFGFRDGRLRVIYKRVTENPGPAAGGPYIWDKPFWSVGASKSGRLSKRAQELADRIFGLTIPSDMQFVDHRKRK